MSEVPQERPTKSASGSLTGNPATGLITQSRWRVAGATTTIGAALMAWYGSELPLLTDSMTVFLSYWAVFLALVVITLYIVLLDIRYIHLQYTISRRELFRQTWEDESFRKALIEAQRKERQEGKRD